MGSFNILSAAIKCSHCNKDYKGRIQFKYGDTWQNEYEIGDKLKWGGNDIGKPGFKMVKVYGILEPDICPICDQENLVNEFDIFIEHDEIIKIGRLQDAKEYFENDGNFKVLVEN